MTFRINRSTFWSLHDLLKPHIEKQTTILRTSLLSECRLAIYLFYIAHGVSYSVMQTQFGCGRTTVSEIMLEVTGAILEHLTYDYIRFSTPEEAMRTIEYWRSKTGIPASLDASMARIFPLFNLQSLENHITIVKDFTASMCKV